MRVCVCGVEVIVGMGGEGRGLTYVSPLSKKPPTLS